MWLGIVVAVLYGAIAVFANFINKYAIKVLPLPNVILLIQTATAALILRAMASCGLIRVLPLREIPVTRLAALTTWYTAHAALVLCSLASLSVPMYNTLKRLTPVIVLVAKAVVDRVAPDLHTSLSVLLIVSGCFIAGAGDLSFDLQGYLLALLATVAQAAYILSAEREFLGKSGKASASAAAAAEAKAAAAAQQQQVIKEVDIESSSSVTSPLLRQSKTSIGASSGVGDLQGSQDGKPASSSAMAGNGPLDGAAGEGGSNVSSGDDSGSSSGSKRKLTAPELLYCLSVISMPALAAMCVVTGEGARAPKLLPALYHKMGPQSFLIWFCTMAVTNGLLNGGVILCTQMNSALTTSIVGVLKGAVSSILGFFLLGGVKFHALNVMGITVNMVGGIWYSGHKYVQNQKRGGGGGGGSVLSG